MAEQILEFFEKEKGTQAILVQHDDGTVYDLSLNGGYTVKMFVHEDGVPDDGVNIVNGETVTVVTPATGSCSWTFNFTAATFNNTRATWKCWIESVDGTVKRFTKPQPFIGRRNKEN